MTTWQPGMRCVCVRVFAHAPTLEDLMLPEKGGVYTVREVLDCDVRGIIFLRLQEIDNHAAIGRVIDIEGYVGRISIEPGYDARQFRPLSERRLDQFRAHLAPAPRRRVDA